MLRKTFLATLICASSSTYAISNGFYLGVGVGPETADYKQTARITRTNLNVKDTTHHSGTGLFGGLFGGYGWQYKGFYLAGELNAYVSSVEFQSSNDEFFNRTFSKTSYKMQRNVGISLLPGYVFNALTLFYARLGYANGNFKISTSDASLANINRSLNGFRFGLGINQFIAPCFNVRMEYSQTNYQTTKFTTVTNATTKTTQVTPQTGQVEFALIYSFA